MKQEKVAKALYDHDSQYEDPKDRIPWEDADDEFRSAYLNRATAAIEAFYE